MLGLYRIFMRPSTPLNARKSRRAELVYYEQLQRATIPTIDGGVAKNERPAPQ
jgi:hypothetical protein